jgi:hypothetical protein
MDHIKLCFWLHSDVIQCTIQFVITVLYSFVHTFLGYWIEKRNHMKTNYKCLHLNFDYRTLNLGTKLIKEWNSSFLSPTLKLSKKNWRCLKDKHSIKPFFDIPYSVLHIESAWMLFNEFILKHNVLILSSVCMGICAEINSYHIQILLILRREVDM